MIHPPITLFNNTLTNNTLSQCRARWWPTTKKKGFNVSKCTGTCDTLASSESEWRPAVGQSSKERRPKLPFWWVKWLASHFGAAKEDKFKFLCKMLHSIPNYTLLHLSLCAFAFVSSLFRRNFLPFKMQRSIVSLTSPLRRRSKCKDRFVFLPKWVKWLYYSLKVTWSFKVKIQLMQIKSGSHFTSWRCPMTRGRKANVLQSPQLTQLGNTCHTNTCFLAIPGSTSWWGPPEGHWLIWRVCQLMCAIEKCLTHLPMQSFC